MFTRIQTAVKYSAKTKTVIYLAAQKHVCEMILSSTVNKDTCVESINITNHADKYLLI